MKTSPSLPKNKLLQLYDKMLLIRKFELAVRKNYRDGNLPGFIHLYLGEEAIGTGVCANLDKDDRITSTHRGHGHAIAKGVDPKLVLAELAGKATGTNGGRGGSMHLFNKNMGMYGSNGLVAGGIPQAVGLGLSAKIQGNNQVAVAFFGDGASNHGSFHESMNLAAIQNIPVIFVCENNLYATDTPIHMSTRNTEIHTKAALYGMPGIAVDGNDVLAVYEAAREAVDRARRSEGPTLIEAKTFRICGHHEGDVNLSSYGTEEELHSWENRCPIDGFRNRLTGWFPGIEKELKQIDESVDERVSEAVEFALSSQYPDASTAHLHTLAEPLNPPIPSIPEGPVETEGWLNAVSAGIADEMRKNPNIIYLGEGIGKRGGSMAHTKGLWQEFGPERVIDTPISELGFTGAAIGASASGCRAVADMMFADFIFDAATQIINQGAKIRYMSNGQVSVPVIIRAMCGAIKNAGPHHSGCYYPMWAHVPGLIVAVPSNPADAKGMFRTALRAGDPVIFLEHKRLLSTKGPVPTGEYLVPLGKAAVVREGTDLTLVSCGYMLTLCMEASEELGKQSVSCEVIDLRTIVPLDIDTIITSVKKTGRLLTVDESFPTCGMGAEIGQAVVERAFDWLDAPVGRLHPDPVTTPFSPELENTTFLSTEKIIGAARAVINGTPVIPINHTSASNGGPAQTVWNIPSQVSAVETTTTISQSRIDGIPIILPNQDLVIKDATLVQWLKQVGDIVEMDEPIVVIETDKAAVEVESPAAGMLAEILVDEGITVDLGTRIGTISPNNSSQG
ncbi:MAG: pyruvate dehydrogenase complex E1 component subunit beta [Armatimonadota bacterium]